jgi:hypothetical protein
VSAIGETLSRLGFSLTAADGRSRAELDRAEGRLGVAVPAPLRAFHELAGRAQSLDGHWNNFDPPEDWWLDGSKLVFVTEHQAVVIYSVDTAGPEVDSPVLMASNVEPFEWYDVCPRLSEFIEVLLYWEATNGAMPYGGTGLVDPSLRATLERDFGRSTR